MKVLVSQYVMLKKKPKKVKRFEELDELWDIVSRLAMIDEALFKVVKEGMKEFIMKGNFMRAVSHELRSLCVEKVGKLYGIRRFKSTA